MRGQNDISDLAETGFISQVARGGVVKELFRRRPTIAQPFVIQMESLGNVRKVPTVRVKHDLLDFVERKTVEQAVVAPHFHTIRHSFLGD